MHSLTMRRSSRVFLTWAALTVAILLPAQIAAQELTAPYSLEEIQTMLAGPQSEGRIAEIVTEGCLSFEVDAFVILDVKALGASDDFIDALGAACVIEPGTEPSRQADAARQPEAPAPVTPEPEEPPVVVEAASERRSLTGSGFYGSGSWFRLRYSSFETAKTGGLAWATNSGVAEFGLWGEGTRTILDGGVDDLALWDAETGMILNLFLLQPKTSLPLGLYFGGRASFARTWLDQAFEDGTNRYAYGWEGGAFGRVGTDDFSFVPRIARRWMKNRFISDLITEPIVVQTTILGAEANLRGVVPGVFLHIADGMNLTVISLTFAF